MGIEAKKRHNNSDPAIVPETWGALKIKIKQESLKIIGQTIWQNPQYWLCPPTKVISIQIDWNLPVMVAGVHWDK